MKKRVLSLIFVLAIIAASFTVTAFADSTDENQLAEKGLIESTVVKEGKMPEKAIYSLTDSGKKEFESLMTEIASKPIYLFLDFNAVIVNLDKLTPELRTDCLNNIKNSINELKSYLEQNVNLKEDAPDIPETGLAVLQQQYILVQAIETWLTSLDKP